MRCRSEPSPNADVVFDLDKGTVVKALEVQGDWVRLVWILCSTSVWFSRLFRTCLVVYDLSSLCDQEPARIAGFVYVYERIYNGSRRCRVLASISKYYSKTTSRGWFILFLVELLLNTLWLQHLVIQRTNLEGPQTF